MLLLPAILLMACESNPVGGDNDISFSNRQISGQVRFDSALAPEQVFVWLEGFDVATRTDKDGRFQLTLPPPTAQGASGGISGAFRLYYYVANYTLESTEVFTRDGLFVFDTDDIDAEGRVRQTILLFERVKVSTSVQPFRVSKSAITVTAGKSDFNLAIDITLQTPRDTVIVFFPEGDGTNMRPLLFKETATNEVTVLNALVTVPVESFTDTVTTAQDITRLEINLLPDDLLLGQYEIIPFMLINDLPLPKGLRQRLSLTSIEATESYLDIPFIRFGRDRTFSVAQ